MEKINAGHRELEKLKMGIIIAGLAILFLGSIFISQNSKYEPAKITVLPSVPKEDIPVLITLDLNNPHDHDEIMPYQLFANGKLIAKGEIVVSPSSSEKLVYLYPDPPKLGERITFVVKTKNSKGNYEKTYNIPSYPPQVWSSFVSFASFSTSIMSSSMGISITSIWFYNTTFLSADTINTGLIFSLVLILMLVFLELTEPLDKKDFKILGLRMRFGKLSMILFVVFIGMVFSKIMVILG